MKNIIKLFVRFTVLPYYRISFEFQEAICDFLIKSVNLTCISFCDRHIYEQNTIFKHNIILFQVNVTFCIVFLMHTLTEQAISLLHFGGEPFRFILSSPFFFFTGHEFFFHDTLEFNSSIERKIYSQILLCATRVFHLLRIRPRNFFPFTDLQ